MKSIKQQNYLLFYIVLLLLALGITYRFNSVVNEYREAETPIETFQGR